MESRDLLLDASTKQLEAHRKAAQHRPSTTDSTVQPCTEGECSSGSDNSIVMMGPLYPRSKSIHSSSMDLASAPAGLGWGGKSQSLLFHPTATDDDGVAIPPHLTSVATRRDPAQLKNLSNPGSPRGLADSSRPWTSQTDRTASIGQGSQWMVCMFGRLSDE